MEEPVTTSVRYYAQREEDIRAVYKRPYCFSSGNIREGDVENIYSIMNKRFLSLERALDENSRHLRAIDRNFAGNREMRLS